MEVIHSEEELAAADRGERDHPFSWGAKEASMICWRREKLQYVDATCPFVKKIHNIVKKEKRGRTVMWSSLGIRNIPEVEGIMGWAQVFPVTVIQDAEEAEHLSCAGGTKDMCCMHRRHLITINFKDLVEIISKKSYDISVLNTICNATKERQTEAERIAEGVDAMIVIGDKHSSNTQKLFEICKKACKNTYYIQTLDDLDLNQLRSVETVGITAGASTPNNIIEEVQNNVRINF